MNAKTTKNELNAMIVRYGEANEQKKPLLKECTDLSDKIKTAMSERGITTFAAMGYVATVTFKQGKKLNMSRLKAILTKKQLEQLEGCYDPTVTPTLTVTATNAGIKPQIEAA